MSSDRLLVDVSELPECWFAKEVDCGGCVSVLVVVVKGRKLVIFDFAETFVCLGELLV